MSGGRAARPRPRATYVLVWDAREPSILIDAAGPESGPHLSVPEISWWEMPKTGSIPVLYSRAAAVAQEREDRLERPGDDGQVIVRVEIAGDPADDDAVYRFADGREFTLAQLRRAAGQR